MENKTISMLDEIQEAKSTDVLLIEGEYETNKITKENLFKGLVKDEDFESKTEGLVKEDQLTETLKNYVTAEQLGDSLGKLDQLDSIGSLKSTKFDYAEVYTDSTTKETVIDFYAGSNPDGTAIKNEEGIYPEDRDKGEKVHSVRFIAGNVEIEPGTLTTTYPEESTIKTKDIVVIPYVFRTQNRGDAVIYASIVCGEKSKELEFPTNKIGAGSLNLGQLDKGINFITIYAIDAMGQMTNELNFKIICGALEISSTFDDTLDYNNYSKILIPITVDALDDSEMTLTVTIDDKTYTQIVTYGYNEFIFPEEMKTTAVHKVWMQVTTAEFTSNELTFDVIVISSSAILVSSKNTNVSFEEGVSFKLDYRISCDGLTLFKSKIYVNGTMVASNDAIPIGTNYFNCSYEDYPKGEYDIRIVVNSMDDMMQGELIIHVSITQSSFARIDFVRSGLEALFQMSKNTNDSITKEYLLSSVPNSSGQYSRMDLYGYNYNTNGWIDGKLVSNGTAYAEIDFTPFVDNCTSGFTFDISYSSSNMGDDENIVCQCIDPNTRYGIKIDSAQYNIKTENNELSGYYTNDKETRITFVIHRTSTYLDNWIMNDSGMLEVNPNPERKPNPMVQVYIDGILSDVAMLADSGTGINKVYESIVNNEKILINTDKTKTLFGVNAIKTIAIYNRPLDHEEVLQNLIADIDSLAGQKEKYDKNYVTINSDIPTLYFEDSDIGKWSETTKDNKQYLKVTYSSPDPVRFGPSFESLAQTAWQGTSSLAYPVKNIKIKLYKPAKDEDGKDIKPEDKLKIDLFGARDGDGYAENVFTIKVDYMDSSHCRNTGTAKFSTDILFQGNECPARKKDPKTREAINGTPCQIVINGEWIGLGNFNHDKSCFKTLGLETIPNSVRWEIKANTDSSEGAFVKRWQTKGTAASVEEDIAWIYNNINSDFEIVYDEDAFEDNTGEYDVTRYYDELGIYHSGTVIGGYYDYAILSLARYIQFVSDTTDEEEYRRRAPQYFNVDRACRYYLHVMTMGKQICSCKTVSD